MSPVVSERSRVGSCRRLAHRAAAAWAGWPSPGRSRGGAPVGIRQSKRRLVVAIHPTSRAPKNPRISRARSWILSPMRKPGLWNSAGHMSLVVRQCWGNHHVLAEPPGSGTVASFLESARRCRGGDLVGVETGHIGALEEDLSRVRRIQTADGVEEGRLARTVKADDAHDLALLDLEVHAAESPQTAELLGKTPNLGGVVPLGALLDLASFGLDPGVPGETPPDAVPGCGAPWGAAPSGRFSIITMSNTP